jgi:glycosyltransferase involved in cell wall biosynthesis
MSRSVQEPQAAPASCTTVSVVICAYTTSRWRQLQAAVQSVLQQDPPASEIVVVIDHCPRLEESATETFPAGSVHVVTNKAARGLSGARNTGTAHARADVIAFLDDDAVALPGWLAGHARHYAQPDVLGVGGLVVPEWEDHAPRWFPNEFGWVVGCSYLGQPAATAPIRNPIGANMSFRRPVIEAVGGFAQSLGRVGTSPVGCEETELSIRVAAAYPDGRILHEPVASVRHQVPSSRGTWSYFRRRCWAEGRSKARVSRLVSSRSALASERAYVRTILPAGVRRNLVQARRTRDLAHLLRATAICAGLAITTAGYCVGQVGHLKRSRLVAGDPSRNRGMGSL